MAEFKVIRESEAPRPVRQTGRLSLRMREYERYVAQLQRGTVGELSPEQGESVRGLALRVSRAARRIDKNLNTWVDGGKVYFSVS